MDGALIDLELRGGARGAAPPSTTCSRGPRPARAEHGIGEPVFPERNSAQRQRALIGEGLSPADVYAATVRETRETYAAGGPHRMSTPPPGQPSEEELRAAYEAEIKKLRVEDVVIQTVVSLVNLAGRKAGLAPGTEDERDLGQLKLAIEASRALLPLVEEDLGPDAVQVRNALSQLQMAYAAGHARKAAAPARLRPPQSRRNRSRSRRRERRPRAVQRTALGPRPIASTPGSGCNPAPPPGFVSSDSL